MKSRFDQNIVDNLRRQYGEKIVHYTDLTIAKAWREFSQSDEYPDRDETIFPEWCEAVFVEGNQ